MERDEDHFDLDDDFVAESDDSQDIDKFKIGRASCRERVTDTV